MSEPADAVSGRWVRLTDVSAHSPAALAGLLRGLAFSAELAMPKVYERLPGGGRFGAASVISGAASGQVLGMVTSHDTPHFPGVSSLTIFFDQERFRPACAMEAWGIYAARMFALGARKIEMDVLEFNTPVHRIMAKIGAAAEAVHRQHFYVGGRFWDVTVYGFSRADWALLAPRYRAMYPGTPAWDAFSPTPA